MKTIRPGRGAIDRVDAHSAGTIVSGFYQFQDYGGVEGFRAIVAGRPARVVEQVLGSPSPDIAAVPLSMAMPRAERCRFSVVLDTPFDGIPLHSIVELIPESRHGRGLGLRRVHAQRTAKPSEEAIRSIGSGYETVSLEFLSYMIDFAGMTPSSRCLEVGCGIGRMALGLSAYLDGGSYVGLDVMRDALDTARSTFTGFESLDFRHLDIYNGWYNAKGRLSAAEVDLVGEAGSGFDLVFMTSVLTHLFPEDAEHYLHESARALGEGGAVLVTAWLVNARTRPHILEGRSAIAFEDAGGYWVQSHDNPEGAIALDEDFVLGAIERAGLRVEHLFRGFWADQREGLTFQDLLILRRA